MDPKVREGAIAGPEVRDLAAGLWISGRNPGRAEVWAHVSELTVRLVVPKVRDVVPAVVDGAKGETHPLTSHLYMLRVC
ncbi:hypothetical protein GCM10011400_61880 [Paraburkholderia caffeinilytica]|uniref:Uncharacterized protein n=1 Tax=Paraburkholderia caffeinilytica TaxID=1761016 RepID=A0ABQ1NAK8_9BURK|nr:hypothetical protein GCM10011400_61880 [Paraburkholderia caffeinilytica]